MIALMATIPLAYLPTEFVVDCSSWTGNGRATFTYAYVCQDGKIFSSEVVCDPRSTGELVVIALTEPLAEAGWRFEKMGRSGDETMFVIRGSKTSPIKSVTFKGDIWQPVVTARFAILPEKPKK